MPNLPSLNLLIILQLILYSSFINPLLALSQEELNNREEQLDISSELPCLDSSKECVEQLTERAIAHSSKLKTLNDRIALIDRRLGVSKDSIDYAESKLWTNYLPSSTSFGSSVLDIRPLAKVRSRSLK